MFSFGLKIDIETVDFIIDELLAAHKVFKLFLKVTLELIRKLTYLD